MSEVARDSQPAKQAGEGHGTSFVSFADGLAVQVTTRACVHVNNVSATISAVLYHSLSADLLPHVITPATKLNS